MLFFCACTAAMIADAARRRGPIEKDTGVLLLWISGNGVWATAELWTPETSRLPRDAATAFLLGGPVEIGTQFEAVALSLPRPENLPRTPLSLSLDLNISLEPPCNCP